jgi:NAD-dependent dihydropyrimidine dehydrogenase PreA subunit
MTHVVSDAVEVCLVNRFYEGENMLVIHPDECIDCGVCIPECPIDAILQNSESGLETWMALSAQYVRIWPNISSKDMLRPMPSIGRTCRTNLRAISALLRVMAAMDEGRHIALQGGVAAIAILVAATTDRFAIWRPVGERAGASSPHLSSFEGV